MHVGLTHALDRYGYRCASAPAAATGRYAAVPTPPFAQMLVAALLISIHKKTPGRASVAPD